MLAKDLVKALSEFFNVSGELPDSLKFLLTQIPDDSLLERRNAACIIHVFMRDVLKINDLSDVSESLKLSDIYDCRVCAASIMQVYSRKVMEALYKISEDRYVFGGRDLFTPDEFSLISGKIENIMGKQD